MPATSTTVDEYIQAAPVERQEVLRRIRSLCQASLPSYDEVLEGNKPVYKLNDEIKIAFASQEHHIAFFVTDPGVKEAYASDLSDAGDGMVQFNKPADVDFELIEKLLHDTGKAGK